MALAEIRMNIQNREQHSNIAPSTFQQVPKKFTSLSYNILVSSTQLKQQTSQLSVRDIH